MTTSVNSAPNSERYNMNADLPLSLTGWAAVWVDLEDSGLSAYHLRHPQNEQNSSAIEYINHKWYYLEQ